MDRLAAQLTLHEGLRLKPYRDTVGKLTIGVGRNLTDKGISRQEAEILLDDDMDEVIIGLAKRLPWFSTLDPIRSRVLIDMAFNLGVDGLLEFKNTLWYVQHGHYGAAAIAMLQSKWARQVGRRADTLSKMMATGQEVI